MWVRSKTNLLVHLIAAGVLFCAFTSGALAYHDSSVIAWKATGEIAVDGNLDEWNKVSFVRLDREEQLFRDANQWFGESDLSASVYIMWDETNLYIAAEVIDDTPLMYREGFPPDLADSLILYLGFDPDADPHRTDYLPRDFRIILIIDDYYFNTCIDRSMVADPMGIETIGDYGDDQAFDGYEAAVSIIDGGSYAFEAKIPWSNFSSDQIPVFVPADGVEIGFCVEMSDLDFPCPGVATPGICWTGSGECNSNPSQWGVLTFRDGGLQ
jgi:hypothetical protein